MSDITDLMYSAVCCELCLFSPFKELISRLLSSYRPVPCNLKFYPGALLWWLIAIWFL